MAILRRIGVLSFAKLYGVLMALMGLVVAGLFTLFGFGTMTARGGLGMGAGMAGLGAVGIVVFPIFYGVAGFLMGALFAWLYNLVAGWVGGIELELEK